MNWYKTAKEVSHDYSWVYTNLPPKIQDMLIGFGKEIDPDDLYEKEAENGLEMDPHCTVKYGLLTDEVKDIKEILQKQKGGKIYMGESSIFEADKYDVVKIEIESEDLKRIHGELNKLPHEDKYPEYKAHATIAYVKKGRGKKYVGKFKINKSFKFDEVFFGDTDRKNYKIKMAFNLNRKAHGKKIFIGDCTMGLNDDIFRKYVAEDATELAQSIENSYPITLSQFIGSCNLEEGFRNRIMGSKDVFGAGRFSNSNIIWIWDKNRDIHYFYI